MMRDVGDVSRVRMVLFQSKRRWINETHLRVR